MSRRVYMHVGPFKTGSTYLQGSIRARRAELAERGILFPLADGRAHQRAAVDLVGRSHTRRSTTSVRGGWQDAVTDIQRWDGDVAIVSCEMLSAASADAVSRAVDSLAPAEVHLIVTLRDLAALIPSFWQSNVRNRKSVTWHDFSTSLRGDPGADSSYGERFWRIMDVSSVLQRWSERLPPERLHVIVMPPEKSPPELLWERFFAAMGVDDPPPPATPARNVSVGTEQAEALRRLNAGLAGKYPDHLYAKLVKRVATTAAIRATGDHRRMALPPEDFDWVRAHAQRIVDDVTGRGCPVIGDPQDAVPSMPTVLTPDGPFRPDDVRPDKVIDASVHMSIGLLLHLRDLDRKSSLPPGDDARDDLELAEDVTPDLVECDSDERAVLPADPLAAEGRRPAIEELARVRVEKRAKRRSKRRARRAAR